MTPAALAALHALCFDVPRPFTAPEFADLLASDLCFLSPHPFGFALGRVIVDEAELLTLAVHPERRRQGVGRQLLLAFEGKALARGARSAHLEVAADNDEARRLYRLNGYGESGRRSGYYRHPDGTRVDAILLTKQLVVA